MACENVTPAGVQENYEDLRGKLEQLIAMLLMTHGGGGREMRNMMPESQIDHYMVACTNLAEDCSELLDGLRSSLAGVVHV